MAFTLSFFMLLTTVLDQNAILAKAATEGFFYRYTDISEVEKCPRGGLCIKHLGKNYLIKRKDGFSVEHSISKTAIEVEISPENTYISYFLYIWHKAGVHKIQMNKKKIVIDQGVANIFKLQIAGTAPEGPRVIWEKPLKEAIAVKFSNNFEESLAKLRAAYFVKPLSISNDLEDAAEKSLLRLQKEGLIHYSAKTGSIRHTGIDKKVLGENMFAALSPQKAWEMLVNSPSHLYNMINPQFKSYYIAYSESEGFIQGVILFSD